MTLLQGTVILAQAQASSSSVPWLGPLIGVLGGAVVAIFTEPLRRRLFSSRLRLAFDPSRDCLPLTPMQHGSALLQAQYVRLRVVIPSRWIARSCRVYLTNVEVAGSGGTFQRTLYSHAIPLAWSVREDAEFDGNDLPPEINSFADVLYADDRCNAIVPRIRSWPFRYNDLFHSPGTYRLTSRASGDGVKAASLRLLVTWKGLWNTLTVEPAP